MRSKPPATDPCGSMLFEFYRQQVLAVDVVTAVVEKENSREYPLDRLNDMRALINYGPQYSEECVARYDHLVRTAAVPERMSIGRLLRIHMALMGALGTSARLGSAQTSGILRLGRELGNILVHRFQLGPLAEDMSAAAELTRIPAETSASQKHALNIAWKCSELADRLGMGEHVIHAHSHVQLGGQERTIRRAFFHQRRNHYFPYRVITGTVLVPDSSYTLDAPIFRARAKDPILPSDRAFFEVVVEGAAVSDVSELRDVDGTLSSALQSVCAHEERVASALDLDVRKMLIYSAELRDTDRAIGKIWRMTDTAYEDITHRRVTRRLALEDDQAYGKVFFKLIEEGLAVLEAHSEGASEIESADRNR